MFKFATNNYYSSILDINIHTERSVLPIYIYQSKWRYSLDVLADAQLSISII